MYYNSIYLRLFNFVTLYHLEIDRKKSGENAIAYILTFVNGSFSYSLLRFPVLSFPGNSVFRLWQFQPLSEFLKNIQFSFHLQWNVRSEYAGRFTSPSSGRFTEMASPETSEQTVHDPHNGKVPLRNS